MEKVAGEAVEECGPTGWHIGLLCPKCVKAALDDEETYALDFPLGEQVLVAISDRPDWRVVIIPDPVEARKGLKVLVACEFSGIVRDAFIEAGHDAISCDLLPTERPGPHIQGDVRDLLTEEWDVMIAHPPCTYLAVSGARWFKGREAEQAEALAFVQTLLDAPIPRIALENPVGVISTRICKPSQYIHPWEHGHPETKKTGLWLKGLPLLRPSCFSDGRQGRVHRDPPGPDRWKARSRTYPGIAAAMAAQWGSLDANPR